MERVVPVVTGLVQRFDAPISVDTWRASVARASLRRGRGDGQRHQRPGRPRLRAGRSATRRRRRHHPHPAQAAGGRPRAALRRPGARRGPLPQRAGRGRAGRRGSGRAHRARRRTRPGQNRRAVTDAAARLAHAGRSRFSAAPLRLQQDVPRQDPRPRTDRARRGLPRRGSARHRLGLSHPAGARRAGHAARARDALEAIGEAS